MNQEKGSQKKTTKTTTRTQQLQKPWLMTVNKMSCMLCHSGWPRERDVEVVVVETMVVECEYMSVELDLQPHH